MGASSADFPGFSGYPSDARRPIKQETERERERETWGKKPCVQEPPGRQKSRPPRIIRLLGPCDPKQTLATQNRTNRRGSESLRPRRALYLEGTSPGRRRDHLLLAPCGIECRGGRLEAWSRKTGKTTDQKRTNAPPRVQTRPQSSPERIQKTRGAQNGTPKKPQNKKDARPKQANKTKQRGQKEKKNNSTCGGVCGVLLALSSISSKKKKKRKNTNDVVNPNPKTERTRQKKKLDIKRIF